MKISLAVGAVVNARTREGETSLHCAVREGREIAVELLLRAGAGVDVKEGVSRTALYRAVLTGNTSLAERLAAKGADLGAAMTDGRTPMHIESRRPDLA